MPSKALTPYSWLTENPLRSDEQLYAVISCASDADPLTAYRQSGNNRPAMALWADTPYADWLPVMPYLLALPCDSAFLAWVAETDAQDWGWLAISSATPEHIAEHLRSLTQVRLPNSEAVFLRFWDGRHFLPLLEQLGHQVRDVLPVFDRYWVNGQSVVTGQGPIRPALPFPWWEVPQNLLNSLADKDASTVIDNLMQWLKETHTHLYFSTPELSLRQKVEHCVRLEPSSSTHISEHLLAHLQQEIGQ